MTVPECFYRISVKALILDDQNRFLLVKEDNGHWELPGGGLDFGESPQEGLKREIWEEMRLETSYVAPQPSYFFTTPNHNGVFIANVMYETRMVNLDFVPSAECVEIGFFTSGQVFEEKYLYPNVRVFAGIFSAKPI